jgi:hypothetical protein
MWKPQIFGVEPKVFYVLLVGFIVIAVIAVLVVFERITKRSIMHPAKKLSLNHRETVKSKQAPAYPRELNSG